MVAALWPNLGLDGVKSRESRRWCPPGSRCSSWSCAGGRLNASPGTR